MAKNGRVLRIASSALCCPQGDDLDFADVWPSSDLRIVSFACATLATHEPQVPPRKSRLRLAAEATSFAIRKPRVSPCASHNIRCAKPRVSPVVKAPTFATVRVPARLFPIR